MLTLNTLLYRSATARQRLYAHRSWPRYKARMWRRIVARLSAEGYSYWGLVLVGAAGFGALGTVLDSLHLLAAVVRHFPLFI